MWRIKLNRSHDERGKIQMEEVEHEEKRRGNEFKKLSRRKEKYQDQRIQIKTLKREKLN